MPTINPAQKPVQYAIDYRGPEEDQLTFVFVGIDSDTIREVFQWLIAGGNIANGFLLKDEHAPFYRHGKYFWRVSAQLDCPNYAFASVDDMCLLIESRLHTLGRAAKRLPNYNKLLNV